MINAAEAFEVSPSSVSRKLVDLTATKLEEFKARTLADFRLFAIFLDTIHRGGEAFLVALGVDVSGEKRALGFWEGSSENHEICEALFRGLECRGLALSRRILFVTDGGSGLINALRARCGKKLLHQYCAIHKSRNVQRHVPTQYRKAAHHQLKTTWEQTSDEDARTMLLELQAWRRAKNESAADSLLEAFEELLTRYRLKVPALLRKTLISTNPSRACAPWCGTVSGRTSGAAARSGEEGWVMKNMGAAQKTFNGFVDNFGRTDATENKSPIPHSQSALRPSPYCRNRRYNVGRLICRSRATQLRLPW